MKSDMGIGNIADTYYSDPLENQLDLGTGNTILPFVVSESVGARIMVGTKMGQQYCSDARVHEGGFRLMVGRAGLTSSVFGYLPYGSTILRGYYVIECPELDSPLKMKFWDRAPMIPNNVIHYDVWQTVEHEEFGSGQVAGVYFVRPEGRNRQRVQTSLHLWWDEE